MQIYLYLYFKSTLIHFNIWIKDSAEAVSSIIIAIIIILRCVWLHWGTVSCQLPRSIDRLAGQKMLRLTNVHEPLKSIVSQSAARRLVVVLRSILCGPWRRHEMHALCLNHSPHLIHYSATASNCTPQTSVRLRTTRRNRMVSWQLVASRTHWLHSVINVSAVSQC